MKKTMLAILTVLFVLSSCATAPRTMTFRDVPSFDDTNSINEWIYRNVKYDGIKKSIDEVQSPEVTLMRGSGVCIDMCSLFVYLADKNGFGFMQPKMVPVEAGKGHFHVIVDCGPAGFYDPTNGNYLGYELPKGWKVTTWD